MSTDREGGRQTDRHTDSGEKGGTGCIPSESNRISDYRYKPR